MGLLNEAKKYFVIARIEKILKDIKESKEWQDLKAKAPDLEKALEDLFSHQAVVSFDELKEDIEGIAKIIKKDTNG
jgi:hypothetical protein